MAIEVKGPRLREHRAARAAMVQALKELGAAAQASAVDVLSCDPDTWLSCGSPDSLARVHKAAARVLELEAEQCRRGRQGDDLAL